MPRSLKRKRAHTIRGDSVEKDLLQYLLDNGRLAVIKAPPGSGKTSLLISVSAACFRKKMRVAIGTQTNSQADDICTRLWRNHGIAPIRFAAIDYGSSDLPEEIPICSNVKDLPPQRASIVVGTIAKWGFVEVQDPYDFLVIDEAWQMSWASFMPCNSVAARFVLIGDPGQIPPVVTIDTSRWETSPRAPHRPVPDIILADSIRGIMVRELTASRRLPPDSVEVVRGFYDFDFDSSAKPGDRRLIPKSGGGGGVDRVIGMLAEGSFAACTLPTPDQGPPLELDEEVGKAAVKIVRRLLDRSASLVVKDDDRYGNRITIKPEHIGLCATHRIMNNFLQLQLPASLQDRVRVDTPERWQGLERPVMVVVHPLSGVLTPSAFDLETGRLCVMASRHKVAVVVVGRDHIMDTLKEYIPSAEQAVGCPDVTGMGHDRHLKFWRYLEQEVRIVNI
ncbi:MAG: AAA domain-containing protein [Pseudomonadota bacterium]